MNLPKLPNPEEGTISAVTVLSWPWPPSIPEMMYSLQLDSGRIELTWDQQGRITANLFTDDDAKAFLTAMTCPLIVTEPSAIAFCVTWTSGGLQIHVNAELVGSSSSPEYLPKEYRVIMNRSNAVRYDFSEESKAAIRARRDRLAGHGGMPLKAGRQRSTKEGVFDALKDEIAQIEGLHELIKKGGFHHAIGLSAIVRKVIATGTPLPLLQLSAAFINVPLTIYTAAGGRRKLPHDIPPPSTYIVFGACPEPRLLYENPVDLDVWLDTWAGQVGGEHFTHREMIKKIGDTLGAHFDLDVHPTIPALKASRSATVGGANLDFLIQYVGRASVLARHLALKVLSWPAPGLDDTRLS